MMGNDISGLADPDYAAAAAEHEAAIVVTHIRLAPRVADPDPYYDDVVADVVAFLVARAGRAEAAGIPATRIVLDAGLDLGKTAKQSLTLLRAIGEAFEVHELNTSRVVESIYELQKRRAARRLTELVAAV